MYRNMVYFSVFLVLVLAFFAFSAEVWHLGSDERWELVSAELEDGYLFAVAELKRLIIEGETEAVGEGLVRLRRDFPQMAGPDFDAFFSAEALFAAGKYSNANRSYEKFLDNYPASRLYEAALERQFSIGRAFLSGEKIRILRLFKIRGYSYGGKIMEGIMERAGDSPIALKAALSMAESYERRRKFTEAYHKWSEISYRWPGGENGRESLLGMARCKRAAYKGPNYGVSALVSARSYYESYKLRYPEDAAAIDVDGILEQIEEQLAYKQFSTGEYYEKSGLVQASNLYYRMVMDNWPESTAAGLAELRTGAGGIEEDKAER